MENVINIVPGEIIDNNKLVSLFQCSTQGGMRRSHKTNSLVIVSNHVNSIYDDRWVGNILYYTGMGTVGDQSFAFMQNKTLFQSDSLGIKVYLFEVFIEKQYTFIGQVKLADSPFIEEQSDMGGTIRKVCIFPIKTCANGEIPFIDKNVIDINIKAKERQVKKCSDEALLRLAKKGAHKPGVRNVVSKQYERNLAVVEYAKRYANGVCQLCGGNAPFCGKDGEPFLETHHIIWLSKGGSDTIENTVALCPNCHRKMHIVNGVEDRNYLKNKTPR